MTTYYEYNAGSPEIESVNMEVDRDWLKELEVLAEAAEEEEKRAKPRDPSKGWRNAR